MNKIPITKPLSSISYGDIFLLGDHILACGDSTDSLLIEKLCSEKKVKAIVTDPPYGVNYVENKAWQPSVQEHKDIYNDDIETPEEYLKFSESWLKQITPFLDKKNSVYIFNSDKMILPLCEAMRNLKYKFSQLLIWVKTGSVLGRLDYNPQHELIIYGWYGTHTFMRSKDKSVLVCPKPNKNGIHPTMKPISLLRRLILNSTRIGDYVYDPFGGSGSTLISCEHTKRKCLTIELDSEYCKAIINRYSKLSGNSNIYKLT